jgi:putative endonuclease
MALWRSPVRARYGPLKGQSDRLSFFLFMFSMYILKSSTTGRYYVGHTDSLSRRVKEHNTGLSKYTRNHTPWSLVYSEKYVTRSKAMKRELEIKRKKSRKYIEGLIKVGERPDTTES